MNLKAVQFKSEMLQAIRAFFETQDFLEVTTPVLQTSLPLEPNLFAFATTWQTRQSSRSLFLATSPEASLKKMMAQGVGKCFAISHCFRNLEASGPQHTPEFLMLEWYRPDATATEIMNDTGNLVTFVTRQLKLVNSSSNWPRLSLVELFQKYADIDLPAIIETDELFRVAATKGYFIENATWGALFDQVFLNEVEPQLPSEPFFLIDFPARTSPLCLPQTDRPNFAQRFELYIHKMEIGNGNTENLDRDQVEAAFRAEQKFRIRQNLAVATVDAEFLNSLATLNQKYHSVAGIGLGIDRLVMALTHTKTIEEISPLNVH